MSSGVTKEAFVLISSTLSCPKTEIFFKSPLRDFTILSPGQVYSFLPIPTILLEVQNEMFYFNKVITHSPFTDMITPTTKIRLLVMEAMKVIVMITDPSINCHHWN